MEPSPNNTKAPVVVPLKGKQWTFTPLSLQDITALDNWLKSHFLQTVRHSFDETMTEADKEREIAIAQRQAQPLTWISGEGARMMSSLRGVAQLAYQSLVKAHPSISIGEVLDMLTDPQTRMDVIDTVKGLNPSSGGTGDKQPRPTKRRRKPRTKSRKR